MRCCLWGGGFWLRPPFVSRGVSFSLESSTAPPSSPFPSTHFRLSPLLAATALGLTTTLLPEKEKETKKKVSLKKILAENHWPPFSIMMDLPFAVVEPVVVVKTGSAASPEAGVTPELVRRVNEEELHRQQQHIGRHPGDDDDAGSSSSSLVSTSSRGSLVHSGSLVHRGDPSSLLFSMATASATTSAAAAAAAATTTNAAAATTTNAAAATTTKSAAAAAFSTRPAAAIAQGPYVNASSTASSLVSMGGGVRRDNFNNNHNHNINHSNNNHHHHHNRAFGVQSTQQQQQQQQQPLSPPVSQQSPPPPPLHHPLQQHPEWQIDDTYVTVSESGDDDDEVDIVLAADDDDDAYQYNSNDDVNHPSTLAQRWRPSDVWALLLAEGRDDEAAAAATTTTSATTTTTTTSTAPMAGRTGPVTPTTTVASCVDCANGHVRDAATAQQMGNLSAAVEAHAQAAHCYRQAAWLVHHHRDNGACGCGEEKPIEGPSTGMWLRGSAERFGCMVPHLFHPIFLRFRQAPWPRRFCC